MQERIPPGPCWVLADNSFTCSLPPPPPTPACVVQVRRVAALENHPMLSSEEDSVQERIPPGHCWVLADNEALEPPEVIDSRAFGYLDMNLITGRVIYRVNRGD